MEQRNFDAAIIDLDGTLVDTLDDFRVALNMMLADLRLAPLDRNIIEPMIGRGSEHLIRAVLARAGASAALYDAAWHAYQKHYLAINGQHSAVFEGALEGLEILRSRGLRLACLTNKPQLFAQSLLEAKGLNFFFDRVFGGDAFERKKPDALPVLRTCEALGSAPSRTLMVGDSSNDASAARAAGCPVILVTHGYNHGEPVGAVDCDGWLDSLALVGDWLDAGRQGR
ncbi:MAG: phosphoglycolate phosphatase [Ramlibacter sp.]|nr:phosphoglycolate phosphatase [Ramlibacter sp.]